jgi:hypothetical protein
VITRLGLYGGPRGPWGAFAPKVGVQVGAVPASHRLIVTADDRVMTIEAGGRTLTIEPDDRVLVVE